MSAHANPMIHDIKGVAVMEGYHLSAAQWEALFLAYVEQGKPWYPPTTSRSESAAVSRMLRRLEARGFVLRIAAGPSRRRTGGVILTETTLRLMRALEVAEWEPIGDARPSARKEG